MNDDLSHSSILVFKYGLDHSIRLICLLPHTTPLLQPLDVILFSSLSNAYVKDLDEWRASGNKNYNRGDFLWLFTKAQEIAENEQNIRKPFKATGTGPMNETRIVKYLNMSYIELPTSSERVGEVVPLFLPKIPLESLRLDPAHHSHFLYLRFPLSTVGVIRVRICGGALLVTRYRRHKSEWD